MSPELWSTVPEQRRGQHVEQFRDFGRHAVQALW